jgi:hypothetical protein
VKRVLKDSRSGSADSATGATYPQDMARTVGAGVYVVDMASTLLGSQLRSVSEQMRADFEKSGLVKHHGSRGTQREEIVHDFVSLYTARNFDVAHNCEIVAVTGEAAAQSDVVVVDSTTPRLQNLTSHRIVPIEYVYGVIEVKSRLTKLELEEACDNIKSMKQLPRLAYAEGGFVRRYMFGGHLYAAMPPFGLVFTYDSPSILSVAKNLAHWCAQQPPELRPDGVYILGKGALTWVDAKNRQPLSRAAEHDEPTLDVLAPQDGRDVLIPMIMNLSALLTGAYIPPVQLRKYAGGSEEFKRLIQWDMGKYAGAPFVPAEMLQ